MLIRKNMKFSIEGFREPAASNFLLLLLVTDLVFFFFHVLRVMPWFDYPLFSLGADLGYPEMFQYLKELWIIVLLLLVFWKTKAIGYSIWVLLFIYILFDDSLEIHEKVGALIAEKFEFPAVFGLRAVDLGELLVTAMVALLLFIPLFWFYIRDSLAFKKVTIHLLLLLFALAFFGVVIDMLHVIIEDRMGDNMGYLLEGIEESGEMIVMSLMVWYVYLLKLCDGNISISFFKRPT